MLSRVIQRATGAAAGLVALKLYQDFSHVEPGNQDHCGPEGLRMGGLSKTCLAGQIKNSSHPKIVGSRGRSEENSPGSSYGRHWNQILAGRKIGEEAVAKLARFIEPAHIPDSDQVRAPFAFEVLFDIAKTIRRESEDYDCRYTAWLIMLETLEQKLGHTLSVPEYEMLKQLVFCEAPDVIAEGMRDDGTGVLAEAVFIKMAALIKGKWDPEGELSSERSLILEQSPLAKKLVDQITFDSMASSFSAHRAHYSAIIMEHTLVYAMESGVKDLPLDVVKRSEKMGKDLENAISQRVDQKDWQFEKRLEIDLSESALYQSQDPDEHSHPTIEDVVHISKLNLHSDSGLLVGVYDGHGGSVISQLVARKLPEILENIFSPPGTESTTPGRSGRNPEDLGELYVGLHKLSKFLDIFLKNRDVGIDYLESWLAHPPTKVRDDGQKEVLALLDTVIPGWRFRYGHLRAGHGVEQSGLVDFSLNDRLALISELKGLRSLHSGTTAVYVLNYKGTITVVNVGDSRAVALKKVDGHWTSVGLTRDHKPEDPETYSEIRRHGGFLVTENLGNPHQSLKRVDGMLASGRVFGDRDSTTQSTPSITQVPDKIDGIVLGTDGIWDVIDSRHIGPLLELYENLLVTENVERAVDDFYRLKLGFRSSLDGKLLAERSKEEISVFLERVLETHRGTRLMENGTGSLGNLSRGEFERFSKLLTEAARFLYSFDDVTAVCLKINSTKSIQWHPV